MMLALEAAQMILKPKMMNLEITVDAGRKILHQRPEDPLEWDGGGCGRLMDAGQI